MKYLLFITIFFVGCTTNNGANDDRVYTIKELTYIARSALPSKIEAIPRTLNYDIPLNGDLEIETNNLFRAIRAYSLFNEGIVIVIEDQSIANNMLSRALNKIDDKSLRGISIGFVGLLEGSEKLDLLAQKKGAKLYFTNSNRFSAKIPNLNNTSYVYLEFDQ